MTRWAVVISMLACGCSSTIQRLPRNYDGSTEPRCSTDRAPVIVDVVTGIAVAVAGLGIAHQIDSHRSHDDNHTLPEAIALGGLAIGALFEVIGFGGVEVIQDCRTARRQWTAARAAASLAAAAPPRGWFCAASPTGPGLCARERAACERARLAVLGVLPDLGACALVEAAWCSAPDRCAPSEVACAATAGGQTCMATM